MLHPTTPSLLRSIHVVPSSFEEEREGITRIIEALECNQWRAMVMKRKGDPPAALSAPRSPPEEPNYESTVDDISAAMDEVDIYTSTKCSMRSAAVIYAGDGASQAG